MSELNSKIQNLKKSKDVKILFNNFAWLSSLQVATYLFPLLTFPYLAKVIGVEGFGKIAFASAIMVWIQTIADWGFNFTATRDVAQNRDNPQKISDIFSNVLWARCILMLISFVVLLILIALIPKFRDESDIILISFLMIPGHILFPDWFFQAMERMKYITIFNILIKTLFTIAIFIYIKEKDDYILQPLLTSLGYIFAGLIALYLILFRWKIKLKLPNLKTIFLTIKNSTDVFINNLMPNLYNSLSIVILGFWGGSIANGLLDAGTKFLNIAQQIMNTISRTFFPYLSRKIDKHKIYARLNISIAIILSLLLFIFAPNLIKTFFSNEFYGSIKILQIMSLSIIFLSVANIYGTNYLIITHNEQKLRNATTLASTIGFIIAIPLIFFWEEIGAAITITMTRGLLGLFSYVQTRKVRHNNE